MDKNIYNVLLGIFHGVNGLLWELQKYSSEDFLPINKLFVQNDGQAKTFNGIQEPTSARLEYLEIISKITTNLQYQDILRQKLKHIEAINEIVIKEITCKRDNISFSPLLINNITKVNILNMSQLKLISEEYQNIMQELKENLKQMEDYISRVSSVHISLSNHFSNSQMFNNLIIILMEKLKTLSEKTNDIGWNNGEFNNETSALLNSIYTMQSERNILDKIFPSSKLKGDSEVDIFFFK